MHITLSLSLKLFTSYNISFIYYFFYIFYYKYLFLMQKENKNNQKIWGGIIECKYHCTRNVFWGKKTLKTFSTQTYESVLYL